jgi:hypothetical protein
MTKQIILIVSISCMLISSCSTPEEKPMLPVAEPAIYPSPAILDYFPLQEGAYWIYAGNVKWTIPGSSDVVEKEIRWKMEVVRVTQRNNIAGYEMLGAPWDLAWYEEGKEPSEYGIIQAGGKFYRTSIDTVRRLSDEDDLLLALVEEGEIFLDIPLLSGKKFCDTDSLTRADGLYCWVVGEANQADTTGINGINSENKFLAYPISYRTTPDNSMFEFIPEIGISHYTYGHHGTVSEVDVRLIEYHSGE